MAFPLISAGAYGYPKAQAMSVAVDAIGKFLFEHDMMVYLVVFGHTEFLTSKKLFRDVQEYIDDVYSAAHVNKNVEHSRVRLWQRDEAAALDLDQQLASTYRGSAMPYSAPEAAPSMAMPDWEKLLKQTDEGFSQALLRLIDEKGMTDAQCYKRANVDRKLFSKIRSNPAYRPSKPTVFAFALALELSLPEANALLRKAGFALSHSSKFDIIMEYCIMRRYFDIQEINEVLFQFDLPLLGSGSNP